MISLTDREQRVREFSAKFRKAIENSDPHSLGATLRDFPSGSCGDVALMLGTFLSEQELGTFEYVLGTKGHGPDSYSHAWIESDGLIVDITADQFLEIEDPVIVMRGSDWHNSFEQDRPYVADFRIFDDRTVCYLSAIYTKVIANLPTEANDVSQ